MIFVRHKYNHRSTDCEASDKQISNEFGAVLVKFFLFYFGCLLFFFFFFVFSDKNVHAIHDIFLSYIAVTCFYKNKYVRYVDRLHFEGSSFTIFVYFHPFYLKLLIAQSKFSGTKNLL